MRIIDSVEQANINGEMKMTTAITLAIASYAELSGMNELDVLLAIKNGDKVIENSVMMLTFVSSL
jgi:hypothetical protein